MKQDRQGVRTLNDLERKYDLGSIQKTTGSGTEAISRMNQTMSQFMVEVNAKIANIEAGAYDVLTAYPIGSVYTGVTDPSSTLGGTWSNVGTTTINETTFYLWQRTA